MRTPLTIATLLMWMLAACSSSEDSDFRNRYRWLSGKWQGKMEGVTFVEHWKWNKYRFEGKAYSISEGDTITTESTFLDDFDGNVGYSVIVNGEGPFTFALASSENGVHRFTNDDHDFPAVVEYSLEGDSALRITLLGREDIAADPVSYTLKRVKR